MLLHFFLLILSTIAYEPSYPTCNSKCELPSSNTITSTVNNFCECDLPSATLTFGTAVTSIPSYFFENAYIGTVTIPSHIQEIGEAAFCRSTITNLNIQTTNSDLSTINEGAFYHAVIKNLNGNVLTLPNNLETIGESAFVGTKISTIVFPENSKIETIGKNAFAGIITLTSANNIKAKNINEGAFSNCYNLNAPVEILPSGTVGANAFINCYKLTELKINDKKTPTDDDSSISPNAFQNTGISKISVPYLESIGKEAFKNCTNLKESSNLIAETISGSAFEGDILLEVGTVNAKEISSSAFKDCRKLNAEIIIDREGNIRANAFENCYELKTLKFTYDEYDTEPTTIQTQLETQTIGKKAFYRSGLKGPLTIPLTVITIDEEAFAQCSRLNSVTILGSDSVAQTIGKKAFYRSGINISPFVIPYSVTSIGELAFAYCPFTSLTIQGSRILNNELEPPALCTSVGDNAFYACKITTLKFEENDVSFDKTVFRGCPIQSLTLGHITTIPEEAFYGMRTIKETVAIPDNVTSIGKRAFAGCTSIDRITFTDSSLLTGDKISEGAFYGCTNLKSTSIPREITKINVKTYYKCRSLESIEIPNLVTSIEAEAFYGCTELDCELPLPGELTSIGNNAFQGCTKLKGSLLIPDFVETIGEYAFDGCKNFNGNLEIGRSIETIDTYAFRDCTGFTGNLIFPEYLLSSALSINEGAFYGCSGFTGDLVIPRKSQINKYAFYGCYGFNGQLILPDDLDTSDSEGAFYGCSGFIGEIPTKYLTALSKYEFYGCSRFNGSLDLSKVESDEIPDYAFYNCRGLNDKLILKQPLKTVNDYAFYGCSGLKGTLDCSAFKNIHKYAFAKCSGLSGPLNFEKNLEEIQEHAFEDCSGFSDVLTFKVNTLTIDRCAFKGCSGFKKGTLSFIIQSNEEQTIDLGTSGYQGDLAPYYRYDYVLKICNEAFEDTKFKDIYYLGRFAPDCDYDIGISQIKGIHTSSNYANKTFCGNPIHKSKLSGGAIAGIVIACIVVVAAIVILIVFLILRNKKNKDNSEGEVEMNNEP